MYCLVKACHHKYTNTKTLPKWHVVDFTYIFAITLSCATSDTMMCDTLHDVPHFIVSHFRLLKITLVMFLMQKAATI